MVALAPLFWRAMVRISRWPSWSNDCLSAENLWAGDTSTHEGMADNSRYH